MKKYIFSFLLCATGITLAATQAIRSKSADQNKEKVALPSSFYAGMQEVKSPEYPHMVQAGSPDGIPYGLREDAVDDKTVRISWNSPEYTDGYFEDFEGHDDFAINSTGTIGWKYIDGDNRYTYTWAQTNFKNQGQKMAFIIMNHKTTTPSVEGHPYFFPYSGDKMLVCMSAQDAPNNDWIISPQLSFTEDFHFSFRARSYRTENLPMERIRVGYSTSGTTQSSFRFVTPSPYLELPAEWKLYEYTIPKEAKFVCINCVSDDAFMLLIDDIMIATNEVRPGIMDADARNAVKGRHLVGFNVYRDGKKVNQTPVTEVRYTDTADTYAVHKYTVSALYSDGTESAQSQPLSVDVRDPRLLPFQDDFDDWTMDPAKWSTPENPIGTENMWQIDYYTYGLVDPSATYGYSSLSNYDQSLITRELRTLDRASTTVRFDLRLCNWGVYPEEENKLDLQISCDGGTSWQTIDTYDNLQGEFNWTVKEYSLKDFLTSDNFRLRWRAYGKSAMHIDYWYVDDVKVWNPVWGSMNLTVRGTSGALSGVPVTLKSDNGAVYNLTTNTSGIATQGQIEAGTYSVSIVKDGYNIYNGSIVIEQGKTATPVITLTQPKVSLSATSIIPEMSVEGKTTEHLTISNTGDGPMVWRMHYAPLKQSGKPLDFQIHRSWQGSSDLQTSIAFDGEYYYTTSWYFLGEFWKYDRQGNLIEQFRIPDMYYKLYDLAYDGRYFYGSDYSNRLFQLDFENKRIAGIIEISNAPDLKITHVSYNPNNDRFLVGSWNTLTEVRRNGRATSMDAAFDPEENHTIYGSAYDNVTPGGPYLWLTAVEKYNANILDCVMIYQYNLNTKKFTGLKKVVTDIPGYKVGTAMTGINNICGIEGSYDIESGKFTLVGALQQSPSLFFEYNIAECDAWLDFQPRKATLAAGQSQTIDINLDARDGVVGTTYQSAIQINTIPELAKQSVTIGYKATKASNTPRPQNLTVQAGGSEKDALLSWTAPATAPQSYNLYRDGKLVQKGLASTSYTDVNLVRGTYTYYVTAQYAAGESVPSDEVEYVVKHGAPFYQPVQLTSSLTGNRTVQLDWKSPLYNKDWSGELMWGSGEHKDQVGLTSGGEFMVGHLWDADDLVDYRNKQITSASIRIVNQLSYLALCIYQDGQRIARQVYDQNISYGGWTTVQLDNPVTIQPGSDYIIAFHVEHAEGLQPVGIDDAPTQDGHGNLLSADNGENWFSARQMAIEGNINIKFGVQATANTEPAPVGYNIYRNGTLVNSQPQAATSFTENLTQAGDYVYRVSSVYSAGQSALSDSAVVQVVQIGDRLAPSQLASSVERNRNVSLFWGLPIQGSSTFPMNIRPTVSTDLEDYPTYTNSFMAQGTELAVASDCKYIYTSVHTENGRINRYDLNGNYQGHFYIDGVEGIRNITYDGTNFWIATTNTYIYRVDMENGVILDQKPISEYARHLTYIPDLDGGRGGFEVGDWESSIFVSMQGAKLGDGPRLGGCAGTAYYDGKLYSFEQGGSNPHTIVIYDMTTNQKVGAIDLENYTGLNNVESAVAGGMSIVRTPEGLTLLAVAIQNPLSPTEVLFLDLAGVTGVQGYNVYRNGQQVNNAVIRHRNFQETLTAEGTYNYQVQTLYIDGTVSSLSAAETVTIVPVGTAEAPADVKATMTSKGYDVVVSYTEPNLASSTTSFYSFEDQTAGQALSVGGWNNISNSWTVVSNGYHGNNAIFATREHQAQVILPTNGLSWTNLAARVMDSRGTNGTLHIYASEDNVLENFVHVQEFSVGERWSDCTLTLPEGTRYIMIQKNPDNAALLIDALRLNATEPVSSVWGYDIFRDGKQINAEPERSISFVDHSLLPGTYTYQVRQHSVTSAISPLSQPVTLDVDYDNGSQAPTNLRLTTVTTDNVGLAWTAPALGDAISLGWHSGNSYDAAGLPSGGAFYAGVRWTANDLKDYAHLYLSEVEVYINQIPTALYVLVYQGGDLVHRQYVRQLRQYSFNKIPLDRSIAIDATRELRVIVYIEHNEVTVPLGYDEGPAVSGRGNLYSSDGVTYSVMDASDDGIQGNWNISIGLRPYAEGTAARTLNSIDNDAVPMPLFANSVDFDAQATAQPQLSHQRAGVLTGSATNSLRGYNVYCNGSLLNSELLQTTTYNATENFLIYPYYQFRVAAVYSRTGEVFSNTVTVSPKATGIEVVDQSVLQNAGAAYDLMGRKANPETHRGIFIQSGKKMK